MFRNFSSEWQQLWNISGGWNYFWLARNGRHTAWFRSFVPYHTARLHNVYPAYEHAVLASSNCLDYRLRLKFQIPVGERDFCLLESAQPDAVAFLVAYSMCTRKSIQGGKVAGNVKLIIHLYLVRKLKMSCAVPFHCHRDKYGDKPWNVQKILN